MPTDEKPFVCEWLPFRFHSNILTLSTCLILFPALSHGDPRKADLQFGPYELTSEDGRMLELVGAAHPGTHLRIDAGTIYPLGPKGLSVSFSDFSATYYNDGHGPHWGINFATYVWSVILGMYDELYPNLKWPFRYRRAGPIGSLPFLPHLLTNWSIRYDLIGKRTGIWAGPVTDYLVSATPYGFASYLHAGAYFPLWKYDVVGSVAHDPFHHQNRAYVRVGQLVK